MDLSFLYAFLNRSNSSVVITDARAADHPIVFVNAAFEQVTGYASAEVLGRNCRFLQGEDREQPGRHALAAAVAAQGDCECLLRNYRKNGEMFWNKLYVFPFEGEDGAVSHFVGVQHDVTLERTLLARVEAMARDLIQAQESERKALSRELHDELGQRLSALNLLLHRALPLFEAGGETTLWRQAEQEVTSMVGLVRDIAVSLRPPDLDYFGLEASIRQLLAQRLAHGPAWVFEYAGLPARLAPMLEISIYRIVQECVTNIVRHADARQVVVEIVGDAGAREVELIVRDDGCGFEAAAWREQGARQRRVGLSGMEERVQLLGGSFAIDSTPGRGTRITAVLPLLPQAGA
jgi:PAS domain S-box-containing protein